MRSAAARGLERRAALAVLAAFAAVCVVFSGQFPPYVNPNELSRLQTVYAFVEEGTFRVDHAIEVFTKHEDLAVSGGHFYSNKAPGVAFAAIPVYRVLRTVFPRPHSPFDPIFVILRLLVITPVCILALARFLSRLQRTGAPAAALVAAAVAFGTPYAFHARSFFSHAWTAALILLSLDAIQRAEEASSRRRVGFLLWSAGLLAGWAAISEYPAAILAGLLLLRTVARHAPRRPVLFTVGLAVPLALLLAYNAACFGSPFILSSARESMPQYAELAHRGLFGFGPPSPGVALAYLFHPARGLVLLSPFWLWAIAGFVKWRNSREERADWAFCLAATILFFVAMTAYPNWHGGWSFGNRYLLPVLFPAAFALARALDSPLSRWGFAAATVFAVAAHTLLGSTWVFLPADVSWPARNAALWFVAKGWAAPAVFGGSPGWALAAVILAAVAVAAAVGAAVASAGLPRGRASLAGAAGLAAFAVFLAASPPLDFSGRLWRAETLGRLSGRDPGMEELRAVALSATTPEEKRRAAREWRQYGRR